MNTRCQCITKSGKQCSRKANKGNIFCFQHDNGKCTKSLVAAKKALPLKSERDRLRPRIAAVLHSLKKKNMGKDIIGVVGEKIKEQYGEMLDFPRASGKAFVHHIPDKIVTKEEVETYNEEIDMDTISKDSINKALNYLHKIKAKLVNGDFIVFDAKVGYRNDGIAMFYKGEIELLDYTIDDYGTIPPQFQVIKDGVPIDYWSFIKHNHLIWFDSNPFLDQLLKNITYGKIGDYYALYSTFVYEGQKYKVVCNYLDSEVFEMDDKYHLGKEDLSDAIEIFKEYLTSDMLEPYSYELEPYPFDKHTIYTFTLQRVDYLY